MPKLVALIITAVLALGGLVSGATSAQAGCSYNGCIRTRVDLIAPSHLKQGKDLDVGVKVRTDGNAAAQGKVTLTVEGPGEYQKTFTAKYRGTKLHFDVGRLKKPGKYRIEAEFDGADGFRDSSGSDALSVKKD